MADTIDTSKVVIDSTFSMAQSQTPSKEHSLFVFKVGSDGKPEKGSQGWYKIQTLLDALGKIATDAEAGAISAKEAAEAAKAVCEEALSSIGNSDTTGLRGQAVTAINSAKSAALLAIGENDTSGARGNALSKIAEALQNALASIGQNDNEGVRKTALEAIANALNSALSQIGQTDNDGARGDAITAIVEKFNSLSASIADASSAFDTKVSQANAAIDAKVKAASDSASAAAQSAQDAAAAANSPLASETTAGRTRITGNIGYSRPEGVTDPVAANIDVVQQLNIKIGQLETLVKTFYGYVASIGNGSVLEFTVTHNLGTQNLSVNLWAGTGATIPEWNVDTIDNNSVKVTFSEAPAANGISICILPVRMAS